MYLKKLWKQHMLVTLNKLIINIEELGAGTPIYFLHGFAGTTQSWKTVASIFAKKFKCYLIDLPGHGKSNSPSDINQYSMSNLTKLLKTITDSHKIKKAIWIGYSMGGRILLHFAKQYPNKCSGLIFEGTTSGITNLKERNLRKLNDSKLATNIEKNGIEWFVNYWEKLPIFRTQTSISNSQITDQRNMRLNNNVVGLANMLRKIGTGSLYPLNDILPNISIPSLCIAGDKDFKYSTIAKNMSNNLRNSTYMTVQDAGHNTHFEKPEIFTKIVSDFINQLN